MDFLSKFMLLRETPSTNADVHDMVVGAAGAFYLSSQGSQFFLSWIVWVELVHVRMQQSLLSCPQSKSYIARIILPSHWETWKRTFVQ